MNVPLLSRCLQLVSLLYSQAGYSATELARHLGVSTRTVYRYFDLLRDVGIPVSFDEAKGGHVIAPQFRLKVPQLTDEEWAILVLAAHTSAFFSGERLGPVVRQAISKLLSQVSVTLRNEAGNVLRACQVAADARPHTPEEHQRYLQILAAIRRQRQIRVAYQPGEDHAEPVQTKIAPYRLIVGSDATHLIGRSSWHRKTCSFLLSEIQRIELTDDVYRLPPHNVIAKLRPPKKR